MAKYRGKNYYMGAWSYVFLSILYLIPVIGLIFLLIHSFSSSNDNRKHYARSYFARFLLIVILIAVALGVFYLLEGNEAFLTLMQNFQTQMQSFLSAAGLPDAAAALPVVAAELPDAAAELPDATAKISDAAAKLTDAFDAIKQTVIAPTK